MIERSVLKNTDLFFYACSSSSSSEEAGVSLEDSVLYSANFSDTLLIYGSNIELLCVSSLTSKLKILKLLFKKKNNILTIKTPLRNPKTASFHSAKTP